MKNYSCFVIILLLTLLCYVLAQNETDSWEEFKRKFEKNYTSEAEEAHRKSVFLSNLDYIETHNFKSQGKYSQGLNSMSDMTTEEINKLRNGFRLREGFSLEVHQNSMHFFQRLLAEVNKSTQKNISDKVWYETVLTPAKLDYRRYGLVSRVKDQGSCGSCWAFAATGAIESILANQGRPVLLSEQNLIDCSVPYGNNGCSGGLHDSALRYIRDYGIMSAYEYPYTAKEGTCKFVRRRAIVRIRGSVFVPQGSEGLLRLALALMGPIPIAIDAGQKTFQSYSSGVYDDENCETEPAKLNHAVLLIGYGTDPVGGDYWLVKNSWGRSWGEAGYVRMARNKENQCGIASYAVVPVPY